MANRPAVRRLGILLLAAASVLRMAPSTHASAPMDVDTLATDQAALTNAGSSTVAGGVDVLGGHRGLALARRSGTGTVTVGVSGGVLTFSSASSPATRGEAVASWDGDSDPLTLSPNGLGGIDLTSAGDAFRLRLLQATAGTELTLAVYTSSENASAFGLVVPAIAASTDIDVPFSSFVSLSGAGATFTSVGAVTLTIRGTGSSVALDPIRVVSSTPALTASLTDGVTSAAPGDTLSYAATISNTGSGAATAVTLNNPLDTATTLVPGSVEVSPVAFDDQYAGATVGNPFSVAAPGVLTNDVDGNSDPLAVVPTGARATSQGGTATVNGDGSFEYTPPAAFRGLDTFPYQADDGHGIPGPGTVTVQVDCGAIGVSPTSLLAGTRDSAYGPASFSATGATGATTWTETGALPAGMNFSTAGVLDGTPTQDGSFPLTFTATDSLGCSGSQAITLAVNSAPTITSLNAATFTVGTSGSFTVTTTGVPTPSIARGGVALPSGVSFTDNGDGTGTLSGTPDPGTGGTYAITFTASNVAGSSPVQTFTLTVRQTPAITTGNTTTFTVGTSGSFTVTTTGFPAPSIARGGVALPANLSFVDNADGTGTLSGTPAAGTGGTYAITFQATNVAGSSPAQSFTLTVNEAPTVTSANNATFAPGKTGQTFTVDTTGSPRNPGMTITRTGTLPSGVTFTDNGNGTATVAGTPTAGTQAASPYSWVVTAGNGVSPDATQNPFTFNVVCPVITVSGTIPPLTFNTAMATATFSQTGGNGAIAWSATGLPTPLVIGAANAQVTGTPTVTGTFSVDVTATDAGGCTGTKNVTVAVAPVASNDTYSGGVDNTQYVVTGGATSTPGTPSVQVTSRLIANDLPSGNVAATAGTFATSRGGSVDIQTDGTFIYTPKAFTTAPATTVDTFTYTVVSNTGGGTPVASAPGTVTIGLSGRVWYVDNSKGTNGNGQSQSPFNTLVSAAGPASTANDVIYVYAGTGTTSGQNAGIALLAGQSLIGQGAALVVNGNALLGAGTKPQIGNASGSVVTLASGNTVSGLQLSGVTATALLGTTSVGTLTLSDLAIGNTSGAGIALTGGGTVTATGVNTIATTSGTALNVSNTAIGSGHLTFRSISSTSASGSGVVLASTGNAGSLVVTGTGSAASGGTITGATVHGISLTGTLKPQLAWMSIQNVGHNGIDGQSVTDFTLSNTTINNVGTAAAGQYEESSIAFNDGGSFTSSSLSGTVSITNNTLTNARRHGIDIENGSGTIANLTITGNTLTSSTSAAVSLGTAILVMPQGSAGTTAHLTTGTISNNTITGFPSSEGIAVLGGSGNGSNLAAATLGANGTPITISGNSISGGAGAARMGSNAIRVSFNGQVGVGNFMITGNGTVGSPITNIQGQGISVFMGGSVTGTTTVTNNVIVANQTLGAGTQGMAVQVDDGPAGSGTSAADYNFVITGNNVSAYEGSGIRAIARASNGKMDVTIQNNTVGTPILANRNGIRVDSGSAAGDVNVCLLISGNASAGSGVNQGIGLRKQGINATVNDFGIVNLSPSPTTAANAAARVASDNPAGSGVDVLSGDNFVSCTPTP